MKLASRSRVISFLITSRLSSTKHHSFYLTSLEVGPTLGVCLTSIPETAYMSGYL